MLKKSNVWPKAIDFGHVDIGVSAVRKLRLPPAPDPYRYRVFLPRAPIDGLNVDPVCGKVRSDYATEVTIVYVPQSYVTLSVDLLVYTSDVTTAMDVGQKPPRVIALRAVTRPDAVMSRTLSVTSRPTGITVTISTNTAKRSRPINSGSNGGTVIVFNRPTLNELSTDNRYQDWLNPLGESDEVYRETYGRQYNDFMTKVKCFGNVYKRAKFKIPRIEPNAATSEQVKYVVDTRTAEWNFYKEKTSYNFDSIPDDNWWLRFQTYNRFVNAVWAVMIKNRMEKRLNVLKMFLINGSIN